MKKRAVTISVLALVALLLLWLWWSRPVPSREGLDSTAKSSATRPEEKSTAAVPPASAAPTVPASDQPTRLEQLREIARKSNKPIQFFGLVLDQDDNPIPGVKVTLSIRTAKEVTPGVIDDLFEHPVMMTGADGRFALTDAKGALLSVKALEKPGYEPSEKPLNRAHYWYWRDPSQVFRPDAERPEIFRMWKQAGAEKLVRKGIGHAIPYDGTPTSFDLIDGRAVANGGDLRVTLARNPQQIQWGQRNYEWTVTIESLDGGLIASNDEQMYRAPADGYQPRMVVHMAANDPSWTDSKDVAVYLKLRGGKYYGRSELKFMVGADRPTTPFSITSFVNPSGSRNLEYDPLQNVVSSARPQSPGNAPQR